MANEKPYDKETEDIGWDTGLNNIFNPGPAKKVVGWLVNEILPSSFANWLQHFMARYVIHNSANAIRTFTDLASAIAALLPGDVFRYDPDALNTWGGQRAKVTANAIAASRLCTDGARIYYLESGQVYAVTQRAPAGSLGFADVEWNHNAAEHPLNRDKIYDIDTDGAVVAYVGDDQTGGSVGIGFVLNARTGALLFGPHPFGSKPRAAVADASHLGVRRVFFIEDGSTQIQEWLEGVGLANWIDTGQTIKDICCDGQNIYALIVATADPVNQMSLLSYHKVTKALITLITFGDAIANYGPTPARICCDGDHIYGVIDGVAPTLGLKVRKWSRSALRPVIWTVSLTLQAAGADGIFISVDDRFVYINNTELTNGALWILDKNSGVVLHRDDANWIQGHHPAPTGDKIWLNVTPGNITRLGAPTIPRSPGLWLRAGDGFNDTGAELGGAKYQATRQPGRRLALPLTHTGR